MKTVTMDARARTLDALPSQTAQLVAAFAAPGLAFLTAYAAMAQRFAFPPVARHTFMDKDQ